MSNKKSLVLEALAGKAQPLGGLAEYAKNSIVSKILIDKGVGSITLFAFDDGQRLTEHTSPYDAFILIVDGTAAVTIGGREQELSAGQAVIMPANIPHAVRAKGPFKMMLVMIRGEPS
mgnify:CR=1 FL=1